MKGLSTLQGSKLKYQTKYNNINGLELQNKFVNGFNHIKSIHNVINNIENSHTYQQNNFNYLSCAYHLNQKITNFCKNINCLLPLCPKCIKIHTQEHQKLGVFGNFQTINACLQQSIIDQKSRIINLQEVLKITQKMSQYHQFQIKQNRSQIHKAKKQMIDYIQELFKFYQEQIEKKLLSQYQYYSNQLINLHNEIVSIMQNQKILLKKADNKNLHLQFLIDYYSKRSNVNVNQIIINYSNKIESIKPEYIQLSINTYELQRFKVIVKKYLDFGPQFNNEINQSIEKNIMYQRLTLNRPPQDQNKFNNNYQQTTQKSIGYDYRSPIKKLFSQKLDSRGNSKFNSIEKGQIAQIISQKLIRQSKLDTFQSPLQNYSLQRSRRLKA